MGNQLFENIANLVVLLIDMQSDFIDDDEKKGLIPNQISVLKTCSAKGVPVVLIEMRGRGDTNWKLLEVICKIPDEKLKRIMKTKDNAFSETLLENILKKFGAKTILLMGINACACVYETAIEARRRGYEIITSEGLIAGYCSDCRAERRCEWYKGNVIYEKDHNHILQGLELAKNGGV